MANYNELNSEISAWAKVQRNRMIRTVAGLTLKDKVAIRKAAWAAGNSPDYRPLAKSIGVGLRRSDGAISRVNFVFPKHGIYLERGVGRGRKANTSSVKPKPFIKPILDPAIDQLADMLAAGYADIAAGEIKFTVPGIISRRIKIVANNG